MPKVNYHQREPHICLQKFTGKKLKSSNPFANQTPRDWGRLRGWKKWSVSNIW
jgi:hypothetical protein